MSEKTDDMLRLVLRNQYALMGDALARGAVANVAANLIDCRFEVESQFPEVLRDLPYAPARTKTVRG